MNVQEVLDCVPIAIVIVFGILLPVAMLIISGICYWLDDGEESFSYPWPNKLPWVKRFDGRLYGDFNQPENYITLVAVLIVLTLITGEVDNKLFPDSSLSMCLLGVAGVLYVLKLALRVSKALNIHMFDINAHKGG